jgi:hypothetical protein
MEFNSAFKGLMMKVPDHVYGAQDIYMSTRCAFNKILK